MNGRSYGIKFVLLILLMFSLFVTTSCEDEFYIVNPFDTEPVYIYDFSSVQLPDGTYQKIKSIQWLDSVSYISYSRIKIETEEGESYVFSCSECYFVSESKDNTEESISN